MRKKKRLFSTGKYSTAAIIPCPLLKKYNLNSSDYIVLEELNDGILVRKMVEDRSK